MPEVAFFFDEVDERGLAETLLNLDCALIPNVHYGSPTYDVLTSWHSLCEWRDRTRHFFVVTPKHMCSKLSMFQIQNAKGEFAILSKHGGPASEILFCNVVDSGGLKLVEGAWMMHNSFIMGGDSEVKMPVEVRRLFKTIGDYIRRSSVSAQVEGFKSRKWSVGHHAVQRFHAGDFEFGIPGLVVQDRS